MRIAFSGSNLAVAMFPDSSAHAILIINLGGWVISPLQSWDLKFGQVLAGTAGRLSACIVLLEDARARRNFCRSSTWTSRGRVWTEDSRLFHRLIHQYHLHENGDWVKVFPSEAYI